MIETLIWAFTDRLEKVYWVNIAGYVMTDQQVAKYIEEMNKKYDNAKFLITFDVVATQTTIKPLFFKRK